MPKAPLVSIGEIRGFRRDLRVLERIVLSNVKEEAVCCGVSTSQCHILLELDERGVTPVADLIAYIGLEKSTVSRTIDGLVTLGFVDRRENPENRRSQLLELTARGVQAAASIHKACDARYGGILNRLSKTERTTILKSMGKLTQILIARIPSATEDNGRNPRYVAIENLRVPRKKTGIHSADSSATEENGRNPRYVAIICFCANSAKTGKEYQTGG